MSKASRRRARNKQRQRTAAKVGAAGATSTRKAAAVAQRPATKRAASKPVPAAARKPRTPAPAKPGLADALHRLLAPTGLLNVLAIARRDLSGLLATPAGWVVAAIFTFLVSGFGFIATAIANGQATMDGVFTVIASFLIVVLVPVLTMRVLAEERGRGTLELLLTSAVRDWEVTLGKWLGAYLFYTGLLVTTLVYVAILRFYEPNLDLGLVAAIYAGLLAAGAAAVAVGLLASSLTRNQVIAFFVGMAALVATCWWPPANQAFQYAGGFDHFEPFVLGQVALRDLIYFASLLAGALFLTTRVLASRRWR